MLSVVPVEVLGDSGAAKPSRFSRTPSVPSCAQPMSLMAGNPARRIGMRNRPRETA